MVDNAAQGPHIDFEAIGLLFDELRTEVERSADSSSLDIHSCFLYNFRDPEISNLSKESPL